MNTLNKFADAIELIFGVNSITFDPSSASQNNVTGAFNSESNFQDFTSNFCERISRLKIRYENDTKELKNILETVNSISSGKNWQGAFAELAAFDHLNGLSLNKFPTLLTAIKMNVDINAKESLACNLGKTTANLDGYIEDYGLYFDVKCLKDNVNEILQGIYDDLALKRGISNLNILAEYPLDTSYINFQNNRQNLLNELLDQINSNSTPTYISSKVIPGLNYSLKWTAGVNQAVRTYCPFRHASNLFSGIFKYNNKLLLEKPTILVLVSFPWYNQVINGFIDCNLHFYRSYARRIFCQFKGDAKPYQSYDSSYTGTETIFEVTQHISAIIFLEDKTIDGVGDIPTNVKCFTYVNPNAKNPISRLASDYLMEISNGIYDDFKYDNY